MRLHHTKLAFLLSLTLVLVSFGCRARNAEFVTISLDSKVDSLDFLTASAVNANAERLRSLMFNTLVKKNERFEYVGELAKEVRDLDNGSTISFILHNNVKFHDGKPLTSADVKYTFDNLLKASGAKPASFYETVNGAKQPQITAIEAPDATTVNFRIARPALKNQLLSNLVAIPIVPAGTFERQKDQPLGSGPYKFVRYDTGQNVVELQAFPDYWEGAPNIQQLRVKAVADQNAVQAELRSGRVDVAPMMINLPPDTIEALGSGGNLKVEKFPGANVQLITFNTESKPLDNPKVRQAIAYAINREQLINGLLRGQAKIAHSIIPEESWAYTPGTQYTHNVEKAKQLLDEAGFRPDANGRRFAEPIKLKIVAGNTAANQYAQVIQNQLQEAGMPVEIETAETATLFKQLNQGQFQMAMTRWVGGNQDPIFYRNLFATSEIPVGGTGGLNRSRYSNPELDQVLQQAFNETDRERAKPLYARVQEIVSRDLPSFPLWYASNVVVANKRIGNIQVNGSGDWSFVRNLTVEK